jgi:hypothetical protein
MSIEIDFRAALTGFAGLTALVPATSIAENVAPQSAPLPIVVFSIALEPFLGLNGAGHAVLATITTEAWAKRVDKAREIGDQIALAVAAYTVAHPNSIGTVLNRASAYDGDLDTNGDVLTIEWWAL